MKFTQIQRVRPVLGVSNLGGGGGGISGGDTDSGLFPPSGSIPVANGSNQWAWASNVQVITADGSNKLLGPFVNIASGSNVNFTFDNMVGSVPSNTLRIHAAAGGGGGGGAPTTADYLVGTAQGGLSAEIVVGTTPGGELGGTWASPTVDTTHSGSSHAGVVTTHEGAADPHPGYILESLVAAKGDIIGASANDTPAITTVGADDTILMADAAAGAGLKWVAAGSPAAVGTAAVTGTADTFTRGDHVHAHEAAHINHDTTWAAKGDIIGGTANDTAAVLTVAANGSYLRAASGAATGLEWQLNNLAAAVAPTVNEDSGDGYSVGSRWIDTTADKEYVLLDATVGAAVWGETTPTAGGGAPTTADYLVGTAQGGLSAEIVVGTSPGGELGGTWASPTVDSTHSGSAHTDFIAKTIVDVKGDIIAATAADTVARLAAGADDTILMADAAQSTGLKWVASQTPSTQAYSDAAAQGTADTYARGDHKHAMPANLPAGSATALSWPVLGSGTLLTTPEAGAFERDSTNIYGTSDAGNRGYIPLVHFIRATSTRTFTSNTSSQAIFTSPANGRITLETGLYRIEGNLSFSAMSATSGNLLVNILGAGTATLARIMWAAIGSEVAAGGVAATANSMLVLAPSAASIVTASTNTNLEVTIMGTFEVSVAGTMIPAITMVTASASVLAIGSYLRLERMGAAAVVSLGQWD